MDPSSDVDFKSDSPPLIPSPDAADSHAAPSLFIMYLICLFLSLFQVILDRAMDVLQKLISAFLKIILGTFSSVYLLIARYFQ